MPQPLCAEIIPAYQSANDLPTDGSVLVAFISELTDGTNVGESGKTYDRRLVQFVGGTQSIGGLPNGWRVT